MPRARAAKWTPEEDARLIKLRAEGREYGEIEGMMRGRSCVALRVRAQKLGIAVVKPKGKPAAPAAPKPKKERKPEFWTDARVAHLKELNQEGHSYSKIAEIIGTTRNAICAKIDRLGIANRTKAGSVAHLKNREPNPPRESVKSLAERYEAASQAVADPLNLDLMDIGYGQCRFPTSEADGRHYFCGHKTKPGSSYCAVHHGHVYQSAPKRKRGGDVNEFLAKLGQRRAV